MSEVTWYGARTTEELEAMEVGRRMENVSRMAWVQAGGDLFEVTTVDGTFAIGPTLLRALRNLDDAQEEK